MFSATLAVDVPSVRLTNAVLYDKMKESIYVDMLIPLENTILLILWYEQCWWGLPFSKVTNFFQKNSRRSIYVTGQFSQRVVQKTNLTVCQWDWTSIEQSMLQKNSNGAWIASRGLSALAQLLVAIHANRGICDYAIPTVYRSVSPFVHLYNVAIENPK